MQFCIERVILTDTYPVLLARRMDAATISFPLSSNPRLSGVRVGYFAEEIHYLKSGGKTDDGMFAFVLEQQPEGERFSIGQIVELET